VIEKALKMMKAPTNTATPPKASSAGRRKELMEPLEAAEASAAACSPVFVSTVSGSTAPTRVASSSGVTPGCAVMLIEVSLPFMPYQVCTSARGAAIMMVPPSEDALPKLKMPLTVTGTVP
jgi:hypothetical protein